MIPTRQKQIGKNKVEEYDFSSLSVGALIVVYINDKEVEETYNQAVERLERES